MPSKSLTFLAVISLLLFMATCVIWVRSYFTEEYFLRDIVITQHEVRNFDRREIEIAAGALTLVHWHETDSSDVWVAHNYGETMFLNRTVHFSYTLKSIKYPYVSGRFMGRFFVGLVSNGLFTRYHRILDTAFSKVARGFTLRLYGP